MFLYKLYEINSKIFFYQQMSSHSSNLWFIKVNFPSAYMLYVLGGGQS
jgi:hypothetical protein